MNPTKREESPMKTPSFRSDRSFHTATSSNGSPRLNLMEREFHKVVRRIEDRLVHHGDRPQIEALILAFLNRSLGPSTSGVAAATGITPEAAEVHLRALSEAHRIWGQPAHGNETAWHISQEGRAYLRQRGLRQLQSAL